MKMKIVLSKIKKISISKIKTLTKNNDLQKYVKWIYITMFIIIIRIFLNAHNNLLKIIYDSIQITNIFAVIVLTQKTADIEEKQFQLLTNKKANIIIRHNVNLMEEMTLEGKSKAPIKGVGLWVRLKKVVLIE